MTSNHPYPFPHESGFDNKKKKGKKEKNEKEKGVMWLASRLAFSFFSAWSIKPQKGTKKRSGQRRKKSGRIASHGSTWSNCPFDLE
jgi:hypothetical protein